MLSKDELLKYPNYLLTTYQLEIYEQLVIYMKQNDLKNKDVAEKLKVSSSYVSQILNGNFNFTLKKLIELALMMGKVPYLEFVSQNEYFKRERRHVGSNYYHDTVGGVEATKDDVFRTILTTKKMEEKFVGKFS